MWYVPPVALVTQEGDADLYASVDVKDPGYGNSQFSSSSCGLDLIVVPWKDESRDSRHIYLSVVGHGRHQESQYKLYVITPANDDITKYQVFMAPCSLGGRSLFHVLQVWDWDPETGRNVLLVDYDPLEIANDHTLHQLLEQLRQNAVVPAAGVWLTIEHITEWVLYLSLETLKIMIEIFL